MSNKKNNFLVQGSILAMAGILTRVIGIIYRIPLTNILGNGASAYSIAYDIYSLFLLISSLSLPLAVSKIVAARMAKGEVRNAKKALKGSV
ncbi:MAG: oligosaccharide flippase family protein, partial [Lachnospiraceae bacterium]